MKILHTINSGSYGGAENHMLDLVGGMISRGHNVFVWCKDGVMVQAFEGVGASVTTANIKLDIDPGYILSLSKFLRKNKIDVVHAHELKAVVNCLVASKLSGTKVRISHTHTPISEWQIPALKKVLNIKINSFTVNLFSSKEIALTESRKKIKVSEGIKQNKLEVIPNGLDISKFDLSQEEIDECRGDIRQRYGIGLNDYVVGVIGRLTVEKGADILVKAFAKLLQNVHLDKQTTKLLIVGGGNKEEEIKRLVGDLGIEQNVVITGRFEEKDKVAFYYSLDCFAFPSLAEGFGIVLIEAMASKLAIVASDLPVLQEVAGSTAVFFERKNASDLADKLFNVYTKRNRLESVKLEARNRVEKLFSMQRFVDSYENLYKNLLENKS